MEENVNMSDPSCLDLTMAVPTPSSGSEGGGGFNMRDLDMNRPACGFEEDYPMVDVEDDEDGSGTTRPKKSRLSKEQSRLLKESFKQNQTLDPQQKEALALKLKLHPSHVAIWFRNRRARAELKQAATEYRNLKRCFRSVTEENWRLRREVELLRLRALPRPVAPLTVISPQTHEPMPAPAYSLIMCPTCQRVTTSNAGASAGAGGLPFSTSPNTF